MLTGHTLSLRHTHTQLDPESKRTIGVVTKMQLLTKEMGVVEKLQVTSNKALVLPLGCVSKQ